MLRRRPAAVPRRYQRPTHLRHGLVGQRLPLVTNLGALSEPIWNDSGIASLAPRPDPTLLAGVTGELLADALRRRALGIRGQVEYRRRFSLEVTLDVLSAEHAP